MKNEVYCSGRNDKGQLGLGHFKKSVYPPVKHPFFDGKNNFKIYCNAYSTYILHNKSVWSFGGNESGQLGLGKLKENKLNTPSKITIQIKGENQITQIFTSPSSYHLFFKIKDGKIFCNGWNSSGELGLNHQNNIFSPIEWKSSLFNGKDIKIIYTGEYNSFYLTKNNQLFGSGSNNHGALGIGKSYKQLNRSLIPIKIELNKLVDDFKNEKIISLNSGDRFSLIQTEKGNIFAFGYNGYYQLGGNGEYNKDLLKPTKTFKNLKDLKIIESNCGSSHSLVMTKNEKIFSVGYNGNGQTGLGSNEDSIKKVTEALKDIKIIKEQEKQNKSPFIPVVIPSSNQDNLQKKKKKKENKTKVKIVEEKENKKQEDLKLQIQELQQKLNNLQISEKQEEKNDKEENINIKEKIKEIESFFKNENTKNAKFLVDNLEKKMKNYFDFQTKQKVEELQKTINNKIKENKEELDYTLFQKIQQEIQTIQENQKQFQIKTDQIIQKQEKQEGKQEERKEVIFTECLERINLNDKKIYSKIEDERRQNIERINKIEQNLADNGQSSSTSVNEQIEQFEQLYGQLIKDNHKEITEQVQKLKNNQELLMKEYKKRKKIMLEQQHIHQNINLNRFYRTLLSNLSSFFSSLKIIQSGLIDFSKSKASNYVQTGSKLVQSALSNIPIVGNVIGGCVSAFTYLNETKRGLAFRTGGFILGTITQIDHFCEEFSRKLTLRYEVQIKSNMSIGGKIKKKKGKSIRLKSLFKKSGSKIGGGLSENFEEGSVERIAFKCFQLCSSKFMEKIVDYIKNGKKYQFSIKHLVKRFLYYVSFVEMKPLMQLFEWFKSIEKKKKRKKMMNIVRMKEEYIEVYNIFRLPGLMVIEKGIDEEEDDDEDDDETEGKRSIRYFQVIKPKSNICKYYFRLSSIKEIEKYTNVKKGFEKGVKEIESKDELSKLMNNPEGEEGSDNNKGSKIMSSSYAMNKQDKKFMFGVGDETKVLQSRFEIWSKSIDIKVKRIIDENEKARKENVKLKVKVDELMVEVADIKKKNVDMEKEIVDLKEKVKKKKK